MPESGHSRQVGIQNKIKSIFLNASNNCRTGSTNHNDRTKDKIKIKRIVFLRNGAK